MGFFDAVKKIIGLGVSKVETVSPKKSVASGNTIKQTENSLIYAEHLLEYTHTTATQFKASCENVIKNKYWVESSLKNLVNRYDSYVIASYLGTIKKLRNNPGLTGIRFMKILPSQVVEINWFAISSAKANKLLESKVKNTAQLKDVIYAGVDRIISNCLILLAECKSMKNDGVRVGEAKRIQDLALQIKVNLMKHQRDIEALEGDFSRVTALNVLTKMQRLEGVMTTTSKLYMSFEASLSSSKLDSDEVTNIKTYLEESNKSFAKLAGSISGIKNQMGTWIRGSNSEKSAVPLNEFKHYSDVFINECLVRDQKLRELSDLLTFRRLVKVAA